MSEWEPARQPSRAAWKDHARRHLDREQDRRERREQARREYLAQDACHHGRVRKVGMNDLRPWAALECKAGKCPMRYLTAAEVFTQWRNDSQPASPAGDGA